MASLLKKLRRSLPIRTAWTEDLEHAETELRWKRLALSAEGRVLLVEYTLRRLRNGVETIRIISGRQASQKERKAYAG